MNSINRESLVTDADGTFSRQVQSDLKLGNRSKRFRNRLAMEGYTRWEIYTAESIKSFVRKIAKHELKPPGITAEALLALGIEAYCARNKLSTDNHFVTQPTHHNPAHEFDELPLISGLTPRRKISLHNYPDEDLQLIQPVTEIEPRTTSTLVNQSSSTLSPEQTERLSACLRFRQIAYEILCSSTPFGMDREKHKIKVYIPNWEI